MWERIWAVARIDLRLSEEEYLRLDLREFTALHEQVLRLRWQQEASLANIAAAIYQCTPGIKKPPRASDFIFTRRPEDGPRVSKPQTREAIADVFRALMRPRANAR